MKVKELLRANIQKIDLVRIESEFGDLICEHASKDLIKEKHGELDVDIFEFWIYPDRGICLTIVFEDTGE